MRTPDQLVSAEVHYCVSSLVSTLAGSGFRPAVRPDLADLCEQASELAAPIADFEEAALQEGWTETATPGAFTHKDGSAFSVGEKTGTKWQELCEANDIEPYDREVFEHWIVSDWLAEKLEAKGEKVDRDFGGMTVWARTTTGQGIASDWVIETIAAEMNAQHG
ncbi:hypothetical protein EN780_03315 [Mesorhizobium sp. M4B.F.Ca.ET.089.01.1.1]|uniref:hypothetical protein n=1 Tax=Mesorhizobium sp. M4B.F.Ca.ET.089.01.1.1 TaxID=2496662 RepID=UPI000FE39446|nr:hypothetical protein [Mesorhizobium sp. M4B.F.Ca.ET.089.01.1.1]RWX70437.1 hypothetical protein EN780_03315 [Mesorhizobium sp. M4B.F.Ca.ET.089.01.1.1]